jgi:hypothetical protein
MKINKLIRQLLYFKSLGFHEVSLYDDGCYSNEDFEVSTKIITPCQQERVDVFGQPVDIEAVRNQYKTYGSPLSFDDYLAEAVEKRAYNKANWFDGVETLVIKPKE